MDKPNRAERFYIESFVASDQNVLWPREYPVTIFDQRANRKQSDTRLWETPKTGTKQVVTRRDSQAVTEQMTFWSDAARRELGLVWLPGKLSGHSCLMIFRVDW